MMVYHNTRSAIAVGASLLAKNSQAPRSFRKHALSLKFFASKLAPTVARWQCLRGGNGCSDQAVKGSPPALGEDVRT
ncbi:hypothetical protein EUX53_23385 [Pseudomonas orientalis]|nr:hypothetical protein EUX53_23385 [Pseudomonas orientalis]